MSGSNSWDVVRGGEVSLKKSIRTGKEFEYFGNQLRDRHARNVENIGQEQNRMGRGANSAVQQKFQTPGGGSFAQRLEQSMRRGKARQGIVNRGDNAIRNQRLKDRLAMAKSSIARRGQLQESSANAARLEAGLEATRSSAKDMVSSAYGGALGFVAGGAMRGFGDNLFNSSIPAVTDQGTAMADSLNNNFQWDADMFSGSGSQWQNGALS